MARGGGRGNKRGGGAGGAAFTAEDIEARNRAVERKAEERRERRGDSDEDEEEGEGEGSAAKVKFGPIDTGAGAGAGSEDEEEEGAGAAGKAPRGGAVAGGEEKMDAKAAAHEAYMKKHLALETDEAKNDMARLALVRQRRAEAAERKAAETEEAKRAQEAKEAAEKDKKGKKGKKGGGKEEPEFEPIGKIAIKKMKPADLKDALKERGLGIQGQKTELMQRLLDWEVETFGSE